MLKIVKEGPETRMAIINESDQDCYEKRALYSSYLKLACMRCQRCKLVRVGLEGGRRETK
jgi:hypothetical protein